MIRLVLVDDQPGVRQGLRMALTLEPDMTVVAEASTGREAVTLVQALSPDVVLMDVEMPEMDKLRAICLLAWPCASSRRTSVSRSVSGCGLSGALTTCIRRAAWGVNCTCPAAAALMARHKASASVSLSR